MNITYDSRLSLKLVLALAALLIPFLLYVYSTDHKTSESLAVMKESLKGINSSIQSNSLEIKGHEMEPAHHQALRDLGGLKESHSVLTTQYNSTQSQVILQGDKIEALNSNQVMMLRALDSKSVKLDNIERNLDRVLQKLEDQP